MTDQGSKDPQEYRSMLRQKKLLSVEQLQHLISLVGEVLSRESTLVKVRAPVTVVGDIHGQFPDLMELFKIAGEPPQTNMLFLGDYIDRGNDSVECFCYVLCLKLLYPQRVTILRGNHESCQINRIYGFYDECKRKYATEEVWVMFTELFTLLPLAAIVEDSVFCLHGGLSPDLKSLDELANLDRKVDVPHSGPMCDLLWSDPNEKGQGFKPSPRSAGFLFGADITKQFLHTNNLSLIARAHQLVMRGFQKLHDEKVVTIFSAPNYCYRCTNLASIMEVEDDLSLTHTQFHQTSESDEPKISTRCPQYFL